MKNELSEKITRVFLDTILLSVSLMRVGSLSPLNGNL